LTQKRQVPPSQGVRPYKSPFFASRSDRQWSSPVLGQTCIGIPEDLRLKGTEPTRTKIRTRDWQLKECDVKSLYNGEYAGKNENPLILPFPWLFPLPHSLLLLLLLLRSTGRLQCPLFLPLPILSFITIR
jgi:hypothetical protein